MKEKKDQNKTTEPVTFQDASQTHKKAKEIQFKKKKTKPHPVLENELENKSKTTEPVSFQMAFANRNERTLIREFPTSRHNSDVETSCSSFDDRVGYSRLR